MPDFDLIAAGGHRNRPAQHRVANVVAVVVAALGEGVEEVLECDVAEATDRACHDGYHDYFLGRVRNELEGQVLDLLSGEADMVEMRVFETLRVDEHETNEQDHGSRHVVSWIGDYEGTVQVVVIQLEHDLELNVV